jgi:hypothetical protein
LFLEQGISEQQYIDIKEYIKKTPTYKYIEIISYFDEYSRCSNKLTHKFKSCNTLISEPIQKSDEVFTSLLMIDECCAELSDHITGNHIQFMVLIESARQMVNAVTEKYYSSNAKIYLANKIDTEFVNFVYPFQTKLIYKINEKKMKIDGNGKMSIEIKFMQGSSVACIFNMQFTIMDRKFITSIENTSIKSLSSLSKNVQEEL